ncbi:MAG TPA: AAA family ATPase [Pedobacter sp.]|jgi:hypothetical protein
MKLFIHSIDLIGGDRKFDFDKGLNIITGPIATGKTTLMRCLSGMFAGDISVPRETRENVTNLAGQIQIKEETYSIVRPFVTTRNAKVDIAGRFESHRLPVYQGDVNDPLTYRDWLLEKMGLPQLEVPTAPTQIESDKSPLTVSDYLLYCYLRQTEIDECVFGHTKPPKNIKRKYVFEVIYGKFNIEISKLQDRQRELVSELRRLKGQSKTVEEFLEGTNIANRAMIRQEIKNIEDRIANFEKESTAISNRVLTETNTQQLKSTIFNLEKKIEAFLKSVDFEKNSIEQKNALLAQLQTFSSRLTKAIVAGNYLLDYDFIACPRCNSSVSLERAEADICYLCLQTPSQQISRDDLIAEQERIDHQINETRELIRGHEATIKNITGEIKTIEASYNRLKDELDYRTKSYVSATGEKIAEIEHQRTSLQEEKKRYEDYLNLFTRHDKFKERISVIETQLQELELQIEAALSAASNFEDRVNRLEENFRQIVDELRIERFPDHGFTGIDRKTYLPVFGGRRFDEVQSLGLKVMINVAHAVAHQLTSLELNLLLPNILIIDGLSSNLGYKGIDLERIKAMYHFLIKINNQYKDSLQIFVTDNSIPEFAEEFRKYEFTSEDKLIPHYLINKNLDN